jgi:SAM-dependent MidA family methyltransferase
VLVDDTGQETLGEPVTGADLDWLEQWWPAGQRAEVGLTRDRAWAALISTARSAAGMALLIDYGHLTGDRPAGGSLAAYAQGRRVAPQPCSRINLTAHVAVDAVRAAGEGQGARTLRCARQREMVRNLPLSAPGRGPLLDLSRRSQLAALGSPAGLGAHWWLLQR